MLSKFLVEQIPLTIPISNALATAFVIARHIQIHVASNNRTVELHSHVVVAAHLLQINAHKISLKHTQKSMILKRNHIHKKVTLVDNT